MKRILVVVVFSLFSISAPTHAADTNSRLSTAIQDQRKAEVIRDIKKEFQDDADYAKGVVESKNFIFEERLVRRYQRQSVPPSPSTEPKHPKGDFDYVVSGWAQEEGMKFIAANEKVLEYGETKQFVGISKYLVAGTMDAETQFGEGTKGDYPIVKSLLTIAVFRPNFQSKGWAENELISFLRICRKNGWAPFTRFGSRTGAFGKPQFEPSSYQQFAMHFDGEACRDGKTSPVPPDLDNNSDTICSIYNYLYHSFMLTMVGPVESRWKLALKSYNKDERERDAILDITDFWSGNPNHHHYQRVAERSPKKRPSTPINKAAAS